jgi:hypothetical protein
MNEPFFYPFSYNIWFQQDQICDLETQCLDLLTSVPKHKKIVLWSLEFMDESILEHTINFVLSNNLSDRTYWILQPSHEYPSRLLSLLGDKVYPIDLDIMLVHLHLFETKASKPNDKWNPDTGRFLFPTGKPFKPNRIRLLHKFYKADLLKHCDWSLFVDNYTYLASKRQLPELSDNEFEIFVEGFNRNLDGIKLLHLTDTSCHTSGFPFDGSMYAKTSFRVVSETMMLNKPMTTEKIWVTMANHAPFIMISYPNSLAYLDKIGYRTFTDYLPIADYDSILDQESRLDAVVENTKAWVSNIHKYRHQIEADVEHNHQKMMTYMAENIKLSQNLCRAIGEPERSVYSIVPLSPEQHAWAIFYYAIKDPDWPDCLVEQNFESLPQSIQAECRDQFGYDASDSH